MHYEFKVKTDAGWDQIPVTLNEYFESGISAQLFAIELARKKQKEVRMNVMDSRQGHYYYPPTAK
jgi:hypothetical protein